MQVITRKQLKQWFLLRKRAAHTAATCNGVRGAAAALFQQTINAKLRLQIAAGARNNS